MVWFYSSCSKTGSLDSWKPSEFFAHIWDFNSNTSDCVLLVVCRVTLIVLACIFSHRIARFEQCGFEQCWLLLGV